jgi:hypothetical protein
VGVRGGTTPYSYQWRFKGEPIAWATNWAMTLTNVQPSDAGPYDIVVSDTASASVTSDPDELKVNPMFVKITSGPLVTDVERSSESLWVDFDNDGDLDVIVDGDSRSSMYRNDGDDVFTRVTNAATTWAAQSSGAAAADFDNDGRVDLFLSAGSAASLFRNLGNGEWQRLSDTPFGGRITGAVVSSWVDYDRDGFVDLFSQIGQSGGGLPRNDALFKNLGDGTFGKLTVEECGLGSDDAQAYGHAWTDYDNDGWPDLCLMGARDTDNCSSGLYRNDGQGNFERVAAGIEFPAGTTLLACPWWPDYDSDGRPDLFIAGVLLGDGTIANLLFRNQGDGTFADVTESSGIFWVNAAARPAWADYNDDGFLDLYLCNGYSTAERNCLYRSNRRHPDNTENTNHWLKVRLEGRVSNRAALGAKVRVETTIGGKAIRQLREIAGLAWYAGAPLLAHFGLDDATNVATLRVEWPSGIVQEFTNQPVDQFRTIVEHEPYNGPAPGLAVGAPSAAGLPLTIQEPLAGARYAVEGSTDLENWAMLLARTSTGGTQSFTDTKTTNYPTRFYRVTVP